MMSMWGCPRLLVSRGDPIFGPCELMIPTHNKSCQPISSPNFFGGYLPIIFWLNPQFQGSSPATQKTAHRKDSRGKISTSRGFSKRWNWGRLMLLPRLWCCVPQSTLATTTPRGLRKKHKNHRRISFFLGERNPCESVCVFLMP